MKVLRISPPPGGRVVAYGCDSGARKELSENLANFISTIAHNSSEIAQRLENFRSHTLASFEPVDKKKEAEDAQMLDVYDQTLGLERFPVQELPIQNSRAGLYIYLNASVSLPKSRGSREALLIIGSLSAVHY